MRRRRFQFFIGEDWWSLAETKRGSLIQSWSWRKLDQARSAINVILAGCSCPIIDLVFDNHDVELHYEDIPVTLSRADRMSYIHRRLNMTYGEAEYWRDYQLQIKASKQGTKIPLLLIGIERTQQELWIESFKKLNCTIRSITYAPIEFTILAKNLALDQGGKPISADVLFLIIWEHNRARICVYEQEYLVLTRLIKNTIKTESFSEKVSTINMECNNTVGYMRRINRLQGKQVHLVLVAPEEIISHTPANLIAPHRQTLLSFAQAGASIGLNVPSSILEEKPHLLVQQVLLDSPHKVNLLPKKKRLEYQRTIIERTLFPATLAATLAIVFLLGWNWTGQQQLKGKIDNIDKDINQVKKAVLTLQNHQQTDITWSEMKAIIEHWEHGGRTQIDIHDWTSKLAKVLKGYPALQSRALGVKSRAGRVVRRGPQDSSTIEDDAHNLSPILYWEMTVEPDAELSIREIDDTLEDLNRTVSQIKGVLKSEISKRPVDTSPNSALIWHDGNSSDDLLSTQIKLTLDMPEA